MEKQRICCYCKFYGTDNDYYCSFDVQKSDSLRSPVTGNVYYISRYCFDRRKLGGVCGPEGKYFEEFETEQQLQQRLDYLDDEN